MLKPIISVDRVYKSVTDSSGTINILTNINFFLEARETVAIVGASGSGKSTLLSIMAGLDTPSNGAVFLNGVNLFGITEDERAQVRAGQVGFIFQSFQLLGSLTALENVMLPLELAGKKNPRSDAKEILERVGLGQRLNQYPKVLSGGEQQRVALARGFVLQPSILFADEPTGSLDFETGKSIMDLMFQLNIEQGTTLVLVTHDAHLAELCDRQISLVCGEAIIK